MCPPGTPGQPGSHSPPCESSPTLTLPGPSSKAQLLLHKARGNEIELASSLVSPAHPETGQEHGPSVVLQTLVGGRDGDRKGSRGLGVLPKRRENELNLNGWAGLGGQRWPGHPSWGGAKRWQETGGLIEAFLLIPLDPGAWGKVYKP